MASIFLISRILMLFHWPERFWNESIKHEKLGKFCSYCSQNYAITNAYCNFTYLLCCQKETQLSFYCSTCVFISGQLPIFPNNITYLLHVKRVEGHNRALLTNYFLLPDIDRFFDENCETRGVFFDISKIFDKVWHTGLLFLLKESGISGDLLYILWQKYCCKCAIFFMGCNWRRSSKRFYP